MLKNDATWLWVILRKNDKMTENDTKRLKKWLKRTWMSKTDYKHQRKKWKGLEIIKNEQKWQSVIIGEKWQKMTENDTKRIKDKF